MTSLRPSSIFWAAFGGLACGITLGACDFDMKDLGDETDSAADSAGDTAGDDAPGGECTPGDQMPAPDGCNTCSCDDGGHWACTELGCDPTTDPGSDSDAGPGDTDPVPPVYCVPGDEWQEDCNTCVCTDEGEAVCTDIACPGECTPGDTMWAPDGCNTCFCDEGGWGCTEIGCPQPAVELCEAVDSSYAGVNAASIVGDELLVSIWYSGGCEEHVFDTCWDGAFAESNPVQTGLALSHTSPPDACDSIVQEDLVFSLLPIRGAYENGYPGTSGEIIVHLDGWDGSLIYTW